MEELKVKAVELLAQSEDVVLATINQNGYPRPCVVSVMKREGIKGIWFATNLNSVKTVNIQANPKTGVCITNKKDSVTLTGKTEVFTDQETKSAMLGRMANKSLAGRARRSQLLYFKIYCRRGSNLD